MRINSELSSIKTDTAPDFQTLYHGVVSKTPISNSFLEDLQWIIILTILSSIIIYHLKHKHYI